MKNILKMQVIGVLSLLSAGLLLAGCKSAPPLAKADALAMIQAKYDQSPAAGVDITVTDLGMRQGITAKYWVESKHYPNGYWADFTLTPDGKKLVKVANGTDVIQWHPENSVDKGYNVIVTTLKTSHLKARDVGDVQDVGTTKTADYTEDVNLDGIPGPLADIAHDPGNMLSTHRMATFTLVNGAWQLQSTQ